MDPVQTDRRGKARSDEPQASGRRAEPRAPVRLPVAVATLNGTSHFGLLEVSLSGARLEGDTLPPVGKEIVLTCGRVEAFGTIVWAAGERCGVHFDKPISLGELVALRRVAVAVESAGMTAEEYEAVSDWKSGLAR